MNEKIEPGLIPTFRVFLIIRMVGHVGLAVWLLRDPVLPRVARFLRIGENSEPFVFIRLLAFALTLSLLVYLSIGPLQHRLKRYYLPIALGLDVVGTMLIGVLGFVAQGNLGISTPNIFFWPFLFNLFLVLVLTGWQYQLQGVVFLCLFIFISDVLFGISMVTTGAIRPVAIIVVNIVRASIFLFVGYLISRLVTAQREQREALSAANRQLVRYASTVEELAISEERNRLARELHDTLAHSLSALAVHLEATHTLIDVQPAEAKTRLERSLEVTRSGLSEARRAIHALRAEPLEGLGLPAALRRYAEEQARLANLSLTLDVSPNLVQLEPSVEGVIYNIGKEGITNVVRHADAQSIHLALHQDGKQLLMEVRDNGSGFDPDQIPDGHYGIRGMHERAAGIGAKVLLSSRPNEGTSIQLEVPIR